MIGSPLSHLLMDQFRSPTSTGVAETFVTLGIIYFGFMLLYQGAKAFEIWTGKKAPIHVMSSA